MPEIEYKKQFWECYAKGLVHPLFLSEYYKCDRFDTMCSPLCSECRAMRFIPDVDAVEAGV